MAVQIAKQLGAAKVIAPGRNRRALDELLSLGADEIVPLEDGESPDAFRKVFEQDVDIVLDYLWGPSAARIIAAASAGKTPLRFVQIGTASNADITLPGALLRASAIKLIGGNISNV